MVQSTHLCSQSSIALYWSVRYYQGMTTEVCDIDAHSASLYNGVLHVSYKLSPVMTFIAVSEFQSQGLKVVYSEDTFLIAHWSYKCSCIFNPHL